MMQGENCRPVELQQPGKRIHDRGQASRFTQQNASSLDAGVLSQRLCLAYFSDRLAAHLSAGESVERGNGGAADRAIGIEPLVVLKIPYCRFGVGSENAVEPSSVEPEIP